MHRRSWLATVVALAMSLGGLSAWAQQEITLADRLNAGLKCRKPEEFAFVEAVVLLVDQQKLTAEMVLGMYRWAVAQRPDFPFYYFQYGLRRRAAAIGVEI